MVSTERSMWKEREQSALGELKIFNTDRQQMMKCALGEVSLDPILGNLIGNVREFQLHPEKG